MTEQVTDAGRENNLRTVRAYFRLQEEKDIDAWLELWDEAEGEFLIPYAPDNFPKSLKGRSIIEPAYKDLFNGYGELNIRNLQIYPMLDPNRFVAEWRSEIELLSSGTTYKNDLIATFTFRNGKLIEYKEYFNPIKFQDVIG
jgi:uncharacterized protein